MSVTSVRVSSTCSVTSKCLQPSPSRLESILITQHPVFEALLAHLPTSAIFDLYHTSRTLRYFLRRYPLAWRDLSFRMLPPPAAVAGTILEQSTSETAAHEGGSRACSLAKLLRLIIPIGSCLARLDLDNTSISGIELAGQVLHRRRDTLEHLSVRGCKEVSLKYHILPFLIMELSSPPDILGNVPLALKSLYVYRCRHHRRRPYLPSSLSRRDSDSQPTHLFIELCHELGIWTDTAWCPVPGPRCHRRKDYYVSRHGTLGDTEIWVPFDRLWRSQNTIGPMDEDLEPSQRTHDRGSQRRTTGKLWEEEESGYGGEALGSSHGGSGEGKGIPTHLRRSHRTFVEGFTCDSCGDKIIERCEQCSIRMHCMGCRKTLCASCAFDRPLKRRRPSRRRETHITTDPAMLAPATSIAGEASRLLLGSGAQEVPRNKFWWAPGAWRSPNKMSESSFDPEFSDEDEAHTLEHAHPLHMGEADHTIPRLDMHWCCLKPSFSGGGGIAYIGAQCGDNIKAAPLPRGQGFEDPAFVTDTDSDTLSPSLLSASSLSSESDDLDEAQTRQNQNGNVDFGEMWKGLATSETGSFDVIPYLEQEVDPGSAQEMRWTSPRSLCSHCYASNAWRVLCGACKHPLCIDHDIKSLSAIKCGYRSLARERETVQAARMCLRNGDAVPHSHRARSTVVFFAKWRPIIDDMRAADRIRAAKGLWAPCDKSYDVVDEAHNAQGPATDSSRAPDASDEYPSYLSAEDARLRQMSRRRTKSMSQMPTFQQSAPPDGSSTDVNCATTLDFGAPRWRGCGRFFCPSPRAAGDPRPRCEPENYVQCCKACGVYVCQRCHKDAGEPSPCSCAACIDTGFICPNCRSHPEIIKRCVWEDEEQIMRRWHEETAERLEADELAAGVAEFMDAVESW